jgi:DNA-binding SARP family transcriptional activator
MAGVHDEIVDRLIASALPFAVVLAPAGFGKTRLAKTYAGRFARSSFVTAAKGSSSGSVLEAIATAIGEQPDCLVLDATESLDDDALKTVLETLVTVRPERLAVMVCGRREPLAFQLSEVFAPQLLMVLRRADLELTLNELKSYVPAGAATSLSAVYRVHYLTRGWPIPALSLLQTTLRGAFDFDPITLDHPTLNEIFDWIDANVLRTLDAELRQMLFALVACPDTTRSDFAKLPAADTGHDDRRLSRSLQLVDIGLTGELRVHPFLSYFLRARHAAELERVARDMAARFVDEGKPIRAVRALIGSGGAEDAAAILDTTTFDEARNLGGYSYPGLALEFFSRTKPLYKHPLMWLNLVPCRSYLVPPAILAREGVDILELNFTRLPTRDRYWITATLSALFVEAGDLATAERYALDIVEPVNGDIETTMSYEVAAMHVDVARGRYHSAFERWRRAGPYLQRFPTWYALHLRAAIAAHFGFGDLVAGEEALRTLLSLARVGGCPALAAFGAMLGAFLEWYRRDSQAFTKYRSEFGRLAQYYDVPLLWRCLASLFGVDLEERDAYPLHDAYADLILAVDGHDKARSVDFTLRAIASADAASNPMLRIAARLTALESGVPGAYREEIVDVAEATDSTALRESVRALAAGDPAVGLLQPLVDRLRQRTSRSQDGAVAGAWVIDVAAGEVMRGGSAVRVSDGTLQLLMLLAVAGRPLGREAIVDRMWPDLDGDSAANALKVCVHRARVQLGDPSVVVVHKSTYTLGNDAATTYQHILDLASAGHAGAAADEIGDGARETYEKLARGLMAGWGQWTWFAPYARTLRDAMRGIGTRLIRDEIQKGGFQLAQQHARMMIDIDGFDEAARGLLLQVYMEMGNHKAARSEYEGFSHLLERELGAKPSPELARILEVAIR